MTKRVVILVLLAGLLGSASRALAVARPGQPEVDLGLLLTRERHAARDAERLRLLGPVVEYAHSPSGGTFTAVRPLFSAYRTAGGDQSQLHVLWPLFSSYRRGPERSWNVLLTLWGRQADLGRDDAAFQYLLLPILAYGRTREGERYGGLFPLAGHLQEFMGRDAFDFVLFPLYLHTRKGKLETWNVLFPIFSRTVGPDQGRWRVFPLYGNAHEPGVNRHFVLWPIWNHIRWSDPRDPGYAFLLFPLMSRVRTETQRSWSVLPPFLRWSRYPKGWEAMAPWPFVQITRREGFSKTFLWPIWGEKRKGPERTAFYLWPIIWSHTAVRPATRIESRQVVPFYYHETRTMVSADPLAPHVSRRGRLWPLASWDARGEAFTFRTLELWPFAPAQAVERLYAPFWTLYTHERNEREVRDEFLWGLYRRTSGSEYRYTSLFPIVAWGGDRANDRVYWQVLKGLVEYEREGETRGFRLFYFLRWP